MDIRTQSFNHNFSMNRASVIIQSSWRGYKTRCRLKQANDAFSFLQRLFRKRRESKRQELNTIFKKQEEKVQIALRSIRLSEQYQQRKLETIASLDSSLVNKFLAGEADIFARKIQAFYRGYRCRKQNFIQQSLERKERAACVIQRTLRSWYEKRMRKRYRFKEWPGLTEERREELQLEIDSKMEMAKQISKAKLPSKIEQINLHNRVQQIIGEQMQQKAKQIKEWQKCEAKLAEIHLDYSILEKAPSFDNLTQGDLVTFRSHSKQVITRAEKYHKRLLCCDHNQMSYDENVLKDDLSFE